MTTTRFTRLSISVAALSLAAISMGADPPAAPKTLVLFDGKTLDGWKKSDFTGSGDVKVEDGTIRLAVGNRMTGITCTRKDLPTTNYELTYEANRLKGSDFFAAATFPVGKSFITFVNGGWSGNITGLSSLNGADASENETSQFFKYQNNTWYRFRVRVTDEVIRCAIDDKEIVVLNYKDLQVGTRLETRENQPLGFATYESASALRKIQIRMLTPAEIAAVNKTE